MNNHTQALATLLSGSRDYLTLAQICKQLDITKDDATHAVRELNRQAQIEVIHAGTGRPSRYGWLHTGAAVGDGTGDSVPLATNYVREAPATPVMPAPPADPHPVVDAELPLTGSAPVSRYLVVANKRRPRITRSAERAKALALAAVRRGAQRAQVFELVPAGVAQRGAEWSKA